MRNGLALSVAITLAMLFLMGCSSNSSSSSATEVHVKLSDYKVEMDKTTIPAGPVKFIIDNGGQVTHEVVLEPAGASDKPFETGGKESEAEDIAPGKSATLDWTIDQPGQYQLACHVTEGEDHYARGMVTAFTVTAR